MSHVISEVKPHEWTAEEALSSGKTAYRIKVDLSANPFVGGLGDYWKEGWQFAASNDTISTKRVVYEDTEDRYDRRPKSRGRTPFGSPKQRHSTPFRENSR